MPWTAGTRFCCRCREEIGITTLSRANGDVVVYTDSGVTLFETTARSVTFAPTITYDPTHREMLSSLTASRLRDRARSCRFLQVACMVWLNFETTQL